MDKLFEHICKRCEAGLPYQQAVQFLLWIYCTLDVLPPEYRQVVVSRQNACALFARLATAGRILVESEAGARDLTHPEHWDELIARFLKKEIVLDDTFPARIGHYV